MGNLHDATALLGAGLSLLPICADGSKKPAIDEWKEFQTRRATPDELLQLFPEHEERGIGIICGGVSGNLMVFDFDDADTAKLWCDLIKMLLGGKELLERLTWIQTPSGGFHAYYRCDVITGNKKLARRRLPNGKFKELIETRGEGGYVLSCYCPPACHKSGRRYELLENGADLYNIPTISEEEQNLLLDTARSFNECAKESTPVRSGVSVADGTGRPGDDFNQNANWDDILTPASWSKGKHSPTGYTEWTRPGGTRASAKTFDKSGLLFVHTTNGAPFENEESYTKFHAYALLNHSGDFAAAAKSLATQGYGKAIAHGVAAQEEPEQELEALPEMDERAYYGIAGEFVRFATEDSEADPSAVLLTLLVFLSVCMGRSRKYMVGSTEHHARLFAVIVGASAKARKGTSSDPVKLLLRTMKECGANIPPIVPGPFSSGEGLIFQVRDESPLVDKTGAKIDPGADDKRVVVATSEFAAGLRASRREGNTLSTVLREAWDGGALAPLTKHNPMRATDSHVGVLGHITKQELTRLLDDVEAFNGFGNRFLWGFARRKKFVPMPDALDDDVMSDFARRFAESLSFAQRPGTLRFSHELKQLWPAVYGALQQELAGFCGVLTNRGDAQVLRLSIVFALLDQSDVIEKKHLEPALAIWEYCKSSVLYIFVGNAFDSDSSRLLSALSTDGVAQTELYKLFSGHITKNKLNSMLCELEAIGKIQRSVDRTSGRPRTVWKIAQKKEE